MTWKPDVCIYHGPDCSDGFDVSEVAKKFGGGGHAQAADFKMVSANLPLCVPMETFL